MQDNRGMYMSGSEQFTYGILTDFEIGKISRADAATLLGIIFKFPHSVMSPKP